MNNWFQSMGGGFWRPKPNDPAIRWHVGKQKAYTVGSVSGQILPADGWYWYTVDIYTLKSTAMVGPFDTAQLAATDCEHSNSGLIQ